MNDAIVRSDDYFRGGSRCVGLAFRIPTLRPLFSASNSEMKCGVPAVIRRHDEDCCR
jgi:hypothetical protein